MPAEPTHADVERLEAALAVGRHVVLRAVDGQHAHLRAGLARFGFLDVTDGGEAGLELHRARP